ncbi:MAG: mechanosensitive ion channel, partial [Flavobacteriales bacterium]|nr:mechanosensitive ion channel [Flavobacteriales bacterium]
MDDVNGYAEQALELVKAYAPKALMALVVLILGLWVIGMITKAMVRVMRKREVDPSLIPFLKGLTSTLLKVMLVISVIQMVGVETTSFIAVLGAAGLAVGMALSGTLQNFAGGVMILVFKPYKVGD